MGRASSASIKTQARYHQLSEVATAQDGSTVYKYVAGKSYTGADEVTLLQTTTSITQSSSCSGSYTNRTTTTLKTVVIKFNVAK
jgi:hypothetical protein